MELNDVITHLDRWAYSTDLHSCDIPGYNITPFLRLRRLFSNAPFSRVEERVSPVFKGLNIVNIRQKVLVSHLLRNSTTTFANFR